MEAVVAPQPPALHGQRYLPGGGAHPLRPTHCAPPRQAPPLPAPPRRACATCRSLLRFARRRAGPAPPLPAKMAESCEALGTVPEHERILQEIESTDTACVGPTLR